MCANSNTALLNAPDFKLPFSIPFSSLMRTSYNIVGFFFCVQNSASYPADMHINLGRRHQKNPMKAFTVSKHRTSM